MKRLPLLFLFLAFSTAVATAQYAQYGLTYSVDSLRQRLANPQQDTSRVLVLVELCAQLRWTRPDSARPYARQALVLARQLGFRRGEALALAEEGYVFRETGDLPKALALTLKGLSITRQYHYRLEEALCIQRIANVYTDLRDYPKAIQYNWESLKIAEAIHNEPFMTIQQQNLAAAYLYANQLDSAKKFLQVAYGNIIRLKLDRSLSGILRNLGFLEEKTGHSAKALAYYQQSVQSALQINDHRNGAFSFFRIASLYTHANQPESVIMYAQKALAQAQAGPFYIHVFNASGLLAAAYQQQQNYRQAFAYQELMLKAKEKLFGAGSIQAMQIIVANEEKRQRELDEAQKMYQAQIRQYALIAGLLVVLLIAFILLRNNRQQQKINRLLYQQKTEISRQRAQLEEANTGLEQTLADLRTTQTQLIQKEKMASLGELTAGIAHEIQNPLNFVNNFAEVSVELAEELEHSVQTDDQATALELATDLRANMKTIAHNGQRASNIVRAMLEHSRSSTGERQLTDLNALCDEYLRLAYQGVRAKDSTLNVTLETHFDPALPLVSVVAGDLSRVLLNLYNNAFYAVSQKAKGQLVIKGKEEIYEPMVWVSTTQVKGHVQIRVRDNGMGIPASIKEKIFQPFFTTKPTGEGTGLGLSISYDIVTKGHGGEMRVESQESTFTEFVVSLPLTSPVRL
ncbi:tetratricopeptide repeat-containing sensor histidine kinase [Spirosoma gilvum]